MINMITMYEPLSHIPTCIQKEMKTKNETILSPSSLSRFELCCTASVADCLFKILTPFNPHKIDESGGPKDPPSDMTVDSIIT